MDMTFHFYGVSAFYGTRLDCINYPRCQNPLLYLNIGDSNRSGEKPIGTNKN